MRLRYYIATRLEQAGLHGRVHSAMLGGVKGSRLAYDWTGHGSVQDAGPSEIARVAVAEAEGIAASHALIVALPGGRGTHTELGIALGLGRKVFIWAQTAADLGDDSGRHCAFYHLGHVEDGARPGHVSDPEIIVGDLDELVERVGSWWDGYQEAFASQVAGTVESVTLAFQGRGRWWSRTLQCTGYHSIKGQDYMVEDTGEVVGSRHVIIVDRGECPVIEDEVLTVVHGYLDVAP